MNYTNKMREIIKSFNRIGFIEPGIGSCSYKSIRVDFSKISINRACYIECVDELTEENIHCIAVGRFDDESCMFISFLHELGHYHENNKDSDIISRELNAWNWAVSYMLKININITVEMLNFIEECYGGYLDYYRLREGEIYMKGIPTTRASFQNKIGMVL